MKQKYTTDKKSLCILQHEIATEMYTGKKEQSLRGKKHTIFVELSQLLIRSSEYCLIQFLD